MDFGSFDWPFPTAPPVYRPDARLKTLWLVRWKDGDATIVTATSRAEAMHLIHVRSTDPATNVTRTLRNVESIDPLVDFEMRVADGTRDSAPRWYRSHLGREAIRWSRRGDEAGAGTTLREIPSPNYRIWGYVWCDGDVVVFTAPDFDTARRRVVSAAPSWALEDLGDPEDVRGDVKAIDRFEMELAWARRRLHPVCYRVWAGERPFEWPPISHTPDDGGDDPLHAEARLPIPTYVRVNARSLRQTPPWTRRTAIVPDLPD